MVETTLLLAIIAGGAAIAWLSIRVTSLEAEAKSLRALLNLELDRRVRSTLADIDRLNAVFGPKSGAKDGN